MDMELLTEDNFLIYCAKHYNNPQCSTTEEFIEDLTRIKYIKKLITRYVENDDLNERLILNHIIVLNNVFSPEILCKICFLKLEEQMHYIKPFLVFLNLLPDKIYNVKKKQIIDTNCISMDNKIVNLLRKL